jgi:hypothetical protein
MCRGQKAQDDETLEAAENRRADLHRRARVDRIRNRYRSRTHFRYACPRVCPPNSVLDSDHETLPKILASVARDVALRLVYRARVAGAQS